MFENFSEICPNCFSTRDGVFCSDCGYDSRKTPKSESILPPFKILNNRYLLGRTLGKGGFGITYLAKDLITNERVAIKEYMPSQLVSRNVDDTISAFNDEGQEFFEASKISFNLEARTLYKLENNDFVVNVTDYFSENNTEYFAMEFLDGVNLKAHLRNQGGKIPYQNALYVLLTVGSALMEVHRLDILHRDISPENIMVLKDGNVKLIDFGAARKYENQQETRNGMTVLYKPGFAPPEQYERAGNQGPWSDIYALAATFYYVVSGEMVPESKNRLEQDKLEPLHKIVEEVPVYVSDIIEKALALDYHDRYLSVEAFFDDLSEVLSNANQLSVETILNDEDNKEEPRVGEATNNSYKLNKIPWLVVETGIQKGTRIRVPDSSEIIIGRAPEMCNFVIDDFPEISRAHCTVGYDSEKEQFVIVDMSSNGTYHSNGQRMPYRAETYLDSNESFYICSERATLKVILA